MPERLQSDALARRIAELPPLPRALAEVVRALGQDQLALDDTVHLIEHDPALAARTIRLANSPFYGAPGRVASVGDAVRLLGLRCVASMLATVALRGVQGTLACQGFDFQRYWRHALATALAARELAANLGIDEGQAFLAGLLHDVGELVMVTFAPQPAAAALAQARAHDSDRLPAEREHLGVTHPELGASVAQHWGFPSDIVQAIGGHCWPQPPGAHGRVGLDGVVHAADAMAHALDLDGADDEAVPALDDSTWDALALAPDQLAALLARTEQGVAALAQA